MKRSLYIFAAITIGYLAIPVLAFGFGQRSGDIENRTAAKLPELSAGSVMDGTYFQQVTDIVDQENPTRADAVAADAWLDLEVFGDSPNPQVIIGTKEPWMYLTQAITQLCEAEGRPPDEMAARVARIVDALISDGVEVHVAVAPDKQTVYPEYLPAGRLDEARCAAAVSDEARRALSSAGIHGYFDIFDQMADAKRTSETELYFPNDSHWNNLGALVYFQRLLEAVSPEIASQVDLVSSTEQHEGDVTILIGLPSSIESARVDVRIPGSVVAREDEAVPGGPPIRRTAATNDQLALLPGKTVIIHDSYLNQMITWIGQAFEEAVFIHWNVYTEDRYANELATADRVIVEVVERGMFNRLGDQLGSDALYDAYLEASRP